MIETCQGCGRWLREGFERAIGACSGCLQASQRRREQDDQLSIEMFVGRRWEETRG